MTRILRAAGLVFSIFLAVCGRSVRTATGSSDMIPEAHPLGHPGLGCGGGAMALLPSRAVPIARLHLARST